MKSKFSRGSACEPNSSAPSLSVSDTVERILYPALQRAVSCQATRRELHLIGSRAVAGFCDRPDCDYNFVVRAASSAGASTPAPRIRTSKANASPPGLRSIKGTALLRLRDDLKKELGPGQRTFEIMVHRHSDASGTILTVAAGRRRVLTVTADEHFLYETEMLQRLCDAVPKLAAFVRVVKRALRDSSSWSTSSTRSGATPTPAPVCHLYPTTFWLGLCALHFCARTWGEFPTLEDLLYRLDNVMAPRRPPNGSHDDPYCSPAVDERVSVVALPPGEAAQMLSGFCAYYSAFDFAHQKVCYRGRALVERDQGDARRSAPAEFRGLLSDFDWEQGDANGAASSGGGYGNAAAVFSVEKFLERCGQLLERPELLRRVGQPVEAVSRDGLGFDEHERESGGAEKEEKQTTKTEMLDILQDMILGA